MCQLGDFLNQYNDKISGGQRQRVAVGRAIVYGRLVVVGMGRLPYPDAAAQIANTIQEKKLNRVVVAACTPRTHEPLFRDTLREGGINQYFFDMANIREHCSWVHSKEKEEATEKAKDIIRMSVARTIGVTRAVTLMVTVPRLAQMFWPS